MSEPVNVDLLFRGIDCGKGLRLSEIGPSTAILDLLEPLPVGTQVELLVESELFVPARVIRIYEAVKGAARGNGIHLQTSTLKNNAAAWWKLHIDAEDPIIPEPAQARANAAVEALPESIDVGTTEAMTQKEIAAVVGEEEKPKRRKRRTTKRPKAKATPAPDTAKEEGAQTTIESVMAPPTDGDAKIEEEKPKRRPRRTTAGTATKRRTRRTTKTAAMKGEEAPSASPEKSDKENSASDPTAPKKRRARRATKKSKGIASAPEDSLGEALPEAPSETVKAAKSKPNQRAQGKKRKRNTRTTKKM